MPTIGNPDRRTVLAGAATVGATAVLPSVRVAPAHASPSSVAVDRPGTLGAIAAARNILYGAAGGQALFDDAAYRALFIQQAKLLTPENALKFGALQPRRGAFTFSTADALVDGARSNGLLARGHTLVWNDRQPQWLSTLSAREIERVFDDHLDTVVPHFAGRLHSWDVVNEPFWLGRDKPGTYRPGPWYNAMGPDYVFRAFRRTAALDRHAKLVLNEAWTERADPVGLAVRAALLRLVDQIRDKGLRLDAVGLQGHLQPGVAYDDSGFADFLHQLASRQVEIFITEFDVDDRSFPGDDAARDRAVAARTTAFLDTVLSVPAVTTVITWGLSDRYTWWRDPATMAALGLDRLARPLPYDELLKPKPMRTAMADAFAARRPG